MKHLRWGMALIVLFMFLALATFAEATGTVTKSVENEGPYTRYRWTFVEDGGAASDSTVSYAITGRIVGVRVRGTFAAATTVKLLDSDARDVLQGLFSDTEATAAATADNRYRVPIDDTSGGYIVLFDETVYIDISSGDGTDTGDVDIIVDTE